MSTSEADYRIRHACRGDEDAIIGLLTAATRWLVEKDTDQWQAPAIENRRRTKVRTDIGEQTLFVVEHLGRIVATITVDEFADTEFWREDDDVRSALYAHRMAVVRAEAGIGLGSAMLDWAAARVGECGRSALRLDAWATNELLHAYYENLGFKSLRVMVVDGRGSGALFERPAAYRDGTGPALDWVGEPAFGLAPSVDRRE